ncbi:MAG: F510_1955 family glycosylhydrolase [Actinomycetota bacterium]
MPLTFTTKTRQAGHKRRLFSALTLLGVVTATLVLYAASRRAPRQGLAAMEGPDVGAVHVHGLGVDPRNDELFAATHLGLLRIDTAGKATRVANRYQDTMGFTVLGPGRFVASGHPDLREHRPVKLGLIESSDAGLTWVPRSLSGTADFHDLASSHGVIYGLDSASGTLMVTADMTRWDTRSVGGLRDIAVAPDDANAVIGLTGHDVVASRDGGRTFAALPAAPALVLVAWGPEGVFGLTDSGDVYFSADDGQTWSPRGSVKGRPAAIAAGGSEIFAALEDGVIVASADGARTWNVRYRSRLASGG